MEHILHTHPKIKEIWLLCKTISEDEEVVERFKHACHNLQLTPRLISTHGGSDNNRYVKEGIRGIVVACAMNDCHSVSEYTTIDELEKSALLALHLMIG